MATEDEDLLAELAAVRRELRELRTEVAGVHNQHQTDQEKLIDFGEIVAHHAEILGAAPPDFKLSPWWWPTMTSSQAREAWSLLVPFVSNVLIARFDVESPLELEPGRLPKGERIRPCWFAHPRFVDRFSELHWSWRGNHRRNASPDGPIQWGQNWVRQTLDELRKDPAKCGGGCPWLDAKKSGDLRWPDRERFIQADIDRREN